MANSKNSRGRSLRLAVGLGVAAAAVWSPFSVDFALASGVKGSQGEARLQVRSLAQKKPDEGKESAWSKWTQPPGSSKKPETSGNVVEWVQSIFAGGEASQRLALPEASKLLLAVVPAMGVATLGDSMGLVGVADVFDLMDATELIREGEAATASILQNDDLIQLQMNLQDGSARLITLFQQVSAKVTSAPLR